MTIERKMKAGVLFLVLVLVALTDCKKLIPVVLVPGDGGAQFNAKLDKPTSPHIYCEKSTSDYFNLWLNVEEILPLILDCFVDNMRLVYNRTTHKTSNSPGVDIQIPGWGNTKSVEWLDPSELSLTSYFAPIVNAMVSWGYERNKTVRGAPYDFRKAPNEFDDFYKRLRDLIEETYTINNNSKVAILGHSMGNPTMLYFYNKMPQAWKDKFIHSHISLAGVWGGAVKPLRLYASGDALNVIFVNPKIARVFQRTIPSSAWLMPSPKLWKKDEVLVVSPNRNYTVADYQQFFKDISCEDGWYNRQDTAGLIYDLTPPGVEVHCLHGHNVDTPGTLVYDEKTWYDEQPKVIPDNGDGTVNLRSLLACTSWIGKQPQKIYHKVFEKAEHLEILKNTEVMDYMKTVLVSS